MKRSLLALAALTAFAGVASAQSSVTLSGRVDAGVARTNSAANWVMQGSQSGYNAFTLSGTEDLGGGMRAFFLMNHRFNIQNGTNNAGGNNSANGNFWRNAWVGLGGGFGDVRMGRILMPLQDVNGGYDAFDTGTVGSVHVNGLFNVANVRANSAIYYRTPKMGGFFAHAAIAAGEGQVNGGANSERPAGFAVGYAAGPLSVAAAWDQNAADRDTVGLYAKYNMGFATLMGQFEKGDTSATADTKGYSISASIPVAVGRIMVGAARITPSVGASFSKVSLGGEYSLSKRTLIYSDVAKLRGDSLTSLQSRAQFDLGVRHAF